MPADPTDRRIAMTLFVSLWAIYAFIGPGPAAINSNSISRMAFVFAVLEDFSPRIDAFAPFTSDQAVFDGHAYMDKAPGLSFMALPVVAAFRGAAELAGFSSAARDGDALTPFFRLATAVAAISTTALWTALAAAAIYRFARARGSSREAALFGAAGFALGTPAFGWATAFFSHGMTGALLFMGFTAVVQASEPGTAPRTATRLAMVAGALLSWAVVVEFTAGAAVLAIAACGAWRLGRVPATRRVRLLVAALIPGASALLPLGLYNFWCFGAPLHLGYASVTGFDDMQRGLFGITLPRAETAAALLFGLKRGLFWIAPLLLVIPLAWWTALRQWPAELGAVLIAVPLMLLLINSGYAYWDGGDSTGPRHLTPGLPFAAAALAPLWDASGAWFRKMLAGLATISVALSFICATVTMVAPSEIQAPLTAYLLPHFLNGDVHSNLVPLGVRVWAQLAILVSLLWLAARRIGGLLAMPDVTPAAAT